MFKVGDKVRFRREKVQPTGKFGDIFTVKCVNDDGKRAFLYNHEDKVGGSTCECGLYHSWVEGLDDIEVISSGNLINNMTLIEKAKLAFKGEPEKSFIKAGVMDSNENLTKDGQELFLTYLLKKNGDDFKTTVVDPILKEAEEIK